MQGMGYSLPPTPPDKSFGNTSNLGLSSIHRDSWDRTSRMSLLILAREEASHGQWAISSLIPGHSFAIYCPFLPKVSVPSPQPLKDMVDEKVWG